MEIGKIEKNNLWNKKSANFLLDVDSTAKEIWKKKYFYFIVNWISLLKVTLLLISKETASLREKKQSTTEKKLWVI